MKPTYSNNKKGPRMPKAQFSKQLITKELWREFIKKYPEHKDMTWNEFFSNWKDISFTIRQEAITNPLGTKLGSYTGEIKLQYLPYKPEVVSQSLSEELGEKIGHLNLISKGKVGKIKWERRWAVKFNKMLQFYAFEPTREMNKMAKDYMDKYPEKLRVSRNTLGGKSIWNQIK